jgi:hypothetical protein
MRRWRKSRGSTVNSSADLKAFIDKAKGRREAKVKERHAVRATVRMMTAELKAAQEACLLAQLVAKQTQAQLEYRVSELSTLALQAILEEDIQLGLQFVEKRGKTEAEMFVAVDGNHIQPKHSTAGGVMDIIGTTLRFSLWSLMPRKSRPSFFLDEPMKWLKGKDLPEKGTQVLSEVSHRLGVQIIMVSHATELIAGADSIIDISKR